MLFDSARISELREQYKTTEPYLLPKILAVDMLEELANEKILLERLFARVTEFKQKQWLEGLLCGLDQKFVPVWFEMMLYDWLLPIGQVTPETGEDMPDYKIATPDQKINIEAKARIISQEERKSLMDSVRVTKLLLKVPLPFVITTNDIRLSKSFDESAFIDAVKEWLNNLSKRCYDYVDPSDSHIAMKAEPFPALSGVVPMHSSFAAISIKPVRSDFRKKSYQHKRVRHDKDPYVIALYYEDPFLGQEEVLDTMFGLPMIEIDRKHGIVINQGRDASGLLRPRKQQLYTTISGVLVFRQHYEPSEKRRSLKGWYIENPFAKTFCNPSFFPTKDSFITTSKTKDGISMNWINKGTA